jgi:hypothetical protein
MLGREFLNVNRILRSTCPFRSPRSPYSASYHQHPRAVVFVDSQFRNNEPMSSHGKLELFKSSKDRFAGTTR